MFCTIIFSSSHLFLFLIAKFSALFQLSPEAALIFSEKGQLAHLRCCFAHIRIQINFNKDKYRSQEKSLGKD